MSAGQVACAKCGRDLPADMPNAGVFRDCPACLQAQRVFAFPALHRRATAQAALPALESNDASCFYHPKKQAVVACDNCGRFLCALCDVEMAGSHRCPACLEIGKRKRKLETVENRRFLFDSVALALSIVPVLIWPLTLLTAPATIFVVIRYWRRPLSILPRTRIRFVVAFFIALGQLCGWALLVYFLFARARNSATG
jgi:hypothetical protein